MKCKYCNADIEQDAKFCTNCGKDLSKFNKCVKCGELLDRDAVFCPYCGTEIEERLSTATEQSEDETSSKDWIWLLMTVVCLAIAGGGYWYFTQFPQSHQLVVAKDTALAEEISDTIGTGRKYFVAAKDFIEKMYKDFYDPYKIERSEKKILCTYFTEEAMQKFYVESSYDEGEYFYCIDFLINGDISGDACPDYGDKVVSRTISPEDDDWLLVTNVWDVIQTPVKVHLKVKSIDGELKIVDIKLDNNRQQDDEEVVTVENLSDFISFSEILKTNGNFEKLVKTHGFKSSVIDETSYFYKNCTVRDGKIVPTGEGSSILIREGLWPGKTYGYLTIEVFDDGVYKQLLSELESLYGSNYVNDHREIPAKWANGMDATFTIEGKASGGIFCLGEFYFE